MGKTGQVASFVKLLMNCKGFLLPISTDSCRFLAFSSLSATIYALDFTARLATSAFFS